MSRHPLPFTPPESIQSAFIGRGLYRLYLQNGDILECVYVGQSMCVSGRIHTHYAEMEKEFTHFDYLLTPDISPKELDELEAGEIFRLKPIYNRTIPRTGRHKRLNQIAHMMRVRPVKLQRWATKEGIESFLGLYDVEMFKCVTNESLV